MHLTRRRQIRQPNQSKQRHDTDQAHSQPSNTDSDFGCLLLFVKE